jgi:transcriptional regulator with XRE-family HTH domain
MAQIKDNSVYLTQSEIAKLLGITVQAFSQWQLAESYVVSRYKYYRLDRVIARWMKIQKNKGGLSLEQERAKLAVEQTRKARIEATKAEKEIKLFDEKIRIEAEKGEIDKKKSEVQLKIKQEDHRVKIGESVNKAKMKKLLSDACVVFSSSLLAASRDLSPDLVGLPDAAAVEAILDPKFREILEEFANTNL